MAPQEQYQDLITRLESCAAGKLDFVILTPTECMAVNLWRDIANRAKRPMAGRKRAKKILPKSEAQRRYRAKKAAQ